MSMTAPPSSTVGCPMRSEPHNQSVPVETGATSGQGHAWRIEGAGLYPLPQLSPVN